MKAFLKSKTFWVNLIALGAIVVQIEYGYIISIEAQVLILGIVNIILRKVTNEEIEGLI